MNYLLDTHVLLWSIFNSKQLSQNASKIILDVNNTIYVSLVSFWEIAIKYNIGKLSLNNVLPEELPTYAEKSGYDILDLNPYEVSSFYKLPKTGHKDPFDRLIIWQCIYNNITLISRDSKLKVYRDFGLKYIW